MFDQTIKFNVTVKALTEETFTVIALGNDYIYTHFDFIGEVLELFMIPGLRDMLTFHLVDGHAEKGTVYKWAMDSDGSVVWADGDTDYPTITVTVNNVEYFDD